MKAILFSNFVGPTFVFLFFQGQNIYLFVVFWARSFPNKDKIEISMKMVKDKLYNINIKLRQLGFVKKSNVYFILFHFLLKIYQIKIAV